MIHLYIRFLDNSRSTGMCDFVVIQLSADQFLSLRSFVSSHGKLQEKREFLLKTFPCFTSPTTLPQPSTFHAKHKRSHRHEQKGNRSEKVKIGCRDLSRENFGRKDFMALMNKMTLANKDTILQSIRNVYRDDCQSIYTEITWSMMQKSPEFHELHLSVLETIRDITTRSSDWQHSWCDIGRVFLVDKKWIPSETILDSEDYDEFCEFVKWRKYTVAAIKALCMLEDHQWLDVPFRTSASTSIMQSIHDHLQNTNPNVSCIGDKLTDALIEQLHTIVSLSHQYEALLRCTSEWFDSHVANLVPKLRPATRFKMYDLRELLDRK